jgi:hypothetical protein
MHSKLYDLMMLLLSFLSVLSLILFYYGMVIPRQIEKHEQKTRNKILSQNKKK